MNDTMVTLVGNVASELRVASTGTGVPVTSFRLASSRRRFDRESGRWSDAETNFVTVVCWRTLADHVASCVGKGDPLIVQGRLRIKNWAKDDRTGINVEVEALAVGHDLARGVSVFRTARRGRPEGAGDEPSIAAAATAASEAA